MTESLQLPIIDLTSPDRISTARAIRQACIEVGFFYLINHGVEENLFKTVIEESKKFFSQPLEEKMKVVRRNHRGYTPLYAENLDPSSSTQGDSKESFYIGPLEDTSDVSNLNQWPAEEILPCWRSTMEDYHKRVMDAGIRLISLIALALELDEDFFHKAGACDSPNVFLRLLHYPGELQLSEQVVYGASAHSDYGMLTLLATDGVGGLQVCREKFRRPQIWEDVHHLSGAFIVNIGDMMERWTNCLFRSTLHRVMPTGQERYSMAFFLEPNPDCMVECLKSCCSDSSPPSFTFRILSRSCSFQSWLQAFSYDLIDITRYPKCNVYSGISLSLMACVMEINDNQNSMISSNSCGRLFGRALESYICITGVSFASMLPT